MALVMLGTNYQDLPLAELEKLERETELIRERLFASAPEEIGLNGGVLIATCNRFEIYVESEKFHDAVDHIIKVVAEASAMPADYVGKILRVRYGSAVAQHLFAVSSGLESMIVGEGEISGQVKRAFTVAQNSGETSTLIERLFQNSMKVSKRVTNATGLGDAGRSVITAAIELHQQRFGSIENQKVLVVGTGAYARVVVAALKRLGVAEIQVFSSSGRAKQFSETHGTVAIKSADLVEALSAVDLVVSASGAREHILTEALVAPAVQARRAAEDNRAKSLRIIDMALSADVAPEAANLEGVEVIDLEYVRANSSSEQTEAILAAQDLVREEVDKFEAEEASRTIDPVVAALRAHVGVWVEDEVERVRRRSGDEAATEVELSLHRVTNALLHTPSINAKSLAKNGKHSEYIQAIKTLFNIDLSAFNEHE